MNLEKIKTYGRKKSHSRKMDCWHFDLTGIAYEDAGHFKYVIRTAVRDLANEMDIEYKQNNEDLSCDFNIEYFKARMKWIERLNYLLQYIGYNYPEEIKTDVFQFSEPAAHPEAKKLEYVQHYKRHPLIGFNKSFFIIYPDRAKRQMWALTADVNELKDATKIETHYQ